MYLFYTIKNTIIIVTTIFKKKKVLKRSNLSNDMSVWSDEMEIERKLVSGKIKSDLIQIGLGLELERNWIEIIDPTSGQPIYGSPLPEPIIESDKRLGQLKNFRYLKKLYVKKIYVKNLRQKNCT